MGVSVAGKIWGDTRLIFSRNNVEIHRISIKKGFHCSVHKHERKFNGFFLESGRLIIKTWKADYDLCDETVLNPMEYVEVSPGEFHQFFAEDDCVCYEIYFTYLDPSDIHRQSVGGGPDAKNKEASP